MNDPVTSDILARSLLHEAIEAGRVIAMAAMNARDDWSAGYLRDSARRVHSTLAHALAASPTVASKDIEDEERNLWALGVAPWAAAS